MLEVRGADRWEGRALRLSEILSEHWRSVTVPLELKCHCGELAAPDSELLLAGPACSVHLAACRDALVEYIAREET